VLVQPPPECRVNVGGGCNFEVEDPTRGSGEGQVRAPFGSEEEAAPNAIDLVLKARAGEHEDPDRKWRDPSGRPCAQSPVAGWTLRRRVMAVALPVHLQGKAVSPVALTGVAGTDSRRPAPTCRIYRVLLCTRRGQLGREPIDASTSQMDAINSAADPATNGRSAV